MIKTEIQQEAIPAVTIRRLWTSDQAAIVNHFLRLDPGSLRMRFGAGVGKDFALRYAKRVMKIDNVVYGAFVDHELRGLAELRSLPNANPASAEAAFSVEAPWQNHGIGNALLESLLASARIRGFKTLHMIWLPENDRMQHLALKQSADLRFDPLQTEATIYPRAPSFGTLVQQVFAETLDYFNTTLERQTARSKT